MAGHVSGWAHDLGRLVVYLAVIASVSYLGSAGVVSGDAVIGLLGAVAGYAAGRVVNGAAGTGGPGRE